MKNIVKEGNVETLNKNILKAKYLKKLSYISIIIELISFSIMEILELIYSTNEIMQESIYFAIKILIILTSSAFLFYSIKMQKIKCLIVGCLIYFILGLVFFVYLIVKEIKNSHPNDDFSPKKDIIYYELIIFLLIGFTIISGVFLFIGCIFMTLLAKQYYKIRLIKEKLIKYDNIFTNKENFIEIEKGTNKINNNFFFNNYSDSNTRFNINTTSFISTKEDPNDFETFNFEARSKIRTSKKIDKANHEKEKKPNSSCNNEKNKAFSRKESSNKSFGFSFIRKSETNDINAKSFVNNPLHENKYLNIINCKDKTKDYNEIINVQYLQNLIDNGDICKNQENRYTTNQYSNTYDSNCDNSVFIETPRDSTTRLLD